MKTFFLKTLGLGLISVFLFIGCSNEVMIVEQSNQKANEVSSVNKSIVEVLGHNIELVNNTLEFNNEYIVRDLVQKLKKKEYISTRQNIEVSTRVNKNLFEICGFKSLYDLYVEAMMNAESYYDRPGGYEEFKVKYKSLYFPETEDDISAYLPVSDPYLAKFLNENGEIIIAGDTVNMKDITSYEQLEDLKLTPPKEELNNNQIKSSDMPLIENWWGGEPRKITVGTSTVIGKRKIGVDNCVVVKNNPQAIYLRFDIVFRKKGFLNAWYNHWALTKNRIYVFLPQSTYEVINPGHYSAFFPQTHDGYSSHDEMFAADAWFTSINTSTKRKRVSTQVQIYYDALRDYNFYVPLINYEWQY